MASPSLRRINTANSANGAALPLPAALAASQTSLRSAFRVPRPVQRLQPLDPTAHHPLRVAPQAGLWPEPTRGRTLTATHKGYLAAPKARSVHSPDKSAPLTVRKG